MHRTERTYKKQQQQHSKHQTHTLTCTSLCFVSFTLRLSILNSSKTVVLHSGWFGYNHIYLLFAFFFISHRHRRCLLLLFEFLSCCFFRAFSLCFYIHTNIFISSSSSFERCVCVYGLLQLLLFQRKIYSVDLAFCCAVVSSAIFITIPMLLFRFHWHIHFNFFLLFRSFSLKIKYQLMN